MEGFQSEVETSGNLVIMEYLTDAYARKTQSDKSIEEEYYEKELLLFNAGYRDANTYEDDAGVKR